VRDNGAAALPPLCLLIAASWQLGRRAATGGAAVALFIAFVAAASFANACTTVRPTFPWYRSVAIHDLAGTICFADPMSDDDVRAALRDVPLRVQSDLQRDLCKLYSPRSWFALSDDSGFFTGVPSAQERLARRAAWWNLVREHPHGYLTHRWAVMRELLGITDSPPWEPVCQMFAAYPEQLKRLHHDHSLSWFQRRAGQWFLDTWSTTLLYRPWAYALVSLVLLGYAARRRDRLLAALLGSGLLYQASFFPGAAAPDYRYSHWLVVCCSLSVVIVFCERLRAGLASSAAVPPEQSELGALARSGAPPSAPPAR
jgi:hypothetical protein